MACPPLNYGGVACVVLRYLIVLINAHMYVLCTMYYSPI